MLVRRALTMLQQQQDANLDKIMQDLRMSRNYMVQTVSQYVFVHKVVLDALRNLLVKHQATLQRQATEAAIQVNAQIVSAVIPAEVTYKMWGVGRGRAAAIG